jgi:pimeloyl-ACP methyl ester carboxylesterase
VSTGSRTKAPDGRDLAYEVSGDPHGWPVFLLHGTPGSRMGPRPRSSLLYRLGVRLICHDRPGYGDSTRHEGRRVADVADDVRSVADTLGVQRFSVVGRSGGGPHALACAALLPDRVVRAAVLVGPAPPDALGLDWFAGMSEANNAEFRTASQDADRLMETLRLRAERAMRDPQSLIEFLRVQMSRPDLDLANAVTMRRLFAQTYVEALKGGPYGWLDDAVALRVHWGFELGDVTVPVRLWHGTEDTFTPVSHTRWLAGRLPNAEVQVQEGAAHFGAVQILPEVLGWLAAPDD